MKNTAYVNNTLSSTNEGDSNLEKRETTQNSDAKHTISRRERRRLNNAKKQKQKKMYQNMRYFKTLVNQKNEVINYKDEKMKLMDEKMKLMEKELSGTVIENRFVEQVVIVRLSPFIYDVKWSIICGQEKSIQRAFEKIKDRYEYATIVKRIYTENAEKLYNKITRQLYYEGDVEIYNETIVPLYYHFTTTKLLNIINRQV
jgi:hypothetical protein